HERVGLRRAGPGVLAVVANPLLPTWKPEQSELHVRHERLPARIAEEELAAPLDVGAVKGGWDGLGRTGEVDGEIGRLAFHLLDRARRATVDDGLHGVINRLDGGD